MSRNLKGVIHMNEPLVCYKIISSKEFRSHERPATEALSHIKQYVQDKSAWLYIDGLSNKIDEITVETLKKASTIVVTNTIVGG
jgi:hypothetical protein